MDFYYKDVTPKKLQTNFNFISPLLKIENYMSSHKKGYILVVEIDRDIALEIQVLFHHFQAHQMSGL